MTTQSKAREAGYKPRLHDAYILACQGVIAAAEPRRPLRDQQQRVTLLNMRLLGTHLASGTMAREDAARARATLTHLALQLAGAQP
jgi:hypothetical protein